MPLDPKLLEILICPEDQAPVKYRQSANREQLVCTRCHRIYPVIDNIPRMLPQTGRVAE